MMKVSIAKLLVIAVLIVFGFSYVLSEYWLHLWTAKELISRGKWIAFGIYGIISLILILSVLLCPFLSNVYARVIFGLVFSMNVAIPVSYHEIIRHPFGQWSLLDIGAYLAIFDLLWGERAMAGEFVQAYKANLLKVALIALPMATVVCWPPDKKFRLLGWWNFLPVISLAAACIVTAYTKGGLNRFSFTATLPAKIAFAVMFRQTDYPAAQPAPVDLARGQLPFRKVVFIMDESIRGDYTTLGNPTVNTTPFLASYGPGLVNFGVAVSAHNCSTISRYILRFGIRPEELPQALRGGLNVGGPTIWQYAKAAGLKTVYIDAFGHLYGLHSGMTVLEYAMVDQKTLVRGKPRYLLDSIIAQKLTEALADPTPSFIYVEKYGVHVPYDDKYPPAQERFPVSGDARERTIALYKNAVSWSVDNFFHKFLTDVDLSDTLIVYTSDHGQNLLDGAYAASHCSAIGQVAQGEGLVPLFLLTSKSDWITRLSEVIDHRIHRSSHFDIIPTLLNAFGYEVHAVRAKYGPSLLDRQTRSRQFLVGFRQGSFRWITVDDIISHNDAR
jgi:glucan phosphoethanolaminetransferase (alkaline phosphatase superfamily)